MSRTQYSASAELMLRNASGMDPDVAARVRVLRVDAEAKAIVTAQASEVRAPDFAAFTMSLRDELSLPVPAIRFAVDSLAGEGHIVSLPSPRKTGKTTFLANLAKSGVDAEPFLGCFATHLSGSVIAVNAEMSTEDYRHEYRSLKIAGDDRIIPLHCRDNGIRVNLLDDVTADRFVKWIREHDGEWLFLDPLKNFLAWSGVGMNDNDGVNRLTIRIQEVHAAAGLRLTVIPMHTPQGQQEPGAERGKGAGEFEDGVDAMWRYSRSGGKGRDSARVLAAEGRRGVGLDETVVHFDAASHRLTLGDGDRTAATGREHEAQLLRIIREHPGIGTTAMLVTAGGDRTAMNAAKNRLESRGAISWVKSGKSVQWTAT